MQMIRDCMGEFVRRKLPNRAVVMSTHALARVPAQPRKYVAACQTMDGLPGGIIDSIIESVQWRLGAAMVKDPAIAPRVWMA